MSAKTLPWLTRGNLQEAGEHTAVYPYARLRNIQNIADCGRAVADEVGCLESEFGPELVQPVYNLLWELNLEPRIFTSHCTAAGASYKPRIDLEYCVATQIIVLFRDFARQNDFEDYKTLINSVWQRVTSHSLSLGVSRARCWSDLSPVHVNYYCQVVSALDGIVRETDDVHHGYGCQIQITGGGFTRLEAAQYWSTSCAIIAAILKATRPRTGVQATPFDHSRHFGLVE